MNNDNHLNLHLHDQMSGWLRESRSVALVWRLGILVTGAWLPPPQALNKLKIFITRIQLRIEGNNII